MHPILHFFHLVIRTCWIYRSWCKIFYSIYLRISEDLEAIHPVAQGFTSSHSSIAPSTFSASTRTNPASSFPLIVSFCLISTQKFRSIEYTGYMTNAPCFIMLTVLSEYSCKRPTVLLASMIYFWLQQTFAFSEHITCCEASPWPSSDQKSL